MGRPFPPVEKLELSDQSGQTFARLVELMQRLLAPDGCPWDRKQDFNSLRRYVIEEAHEVAAAIDSGDREEIKDELGDLLLQVVFQAELARAEGAFGPDDVVKAIVDKLVRRHPHVFGELELTDADEVLQNWERIKASEKGDKPRGLLAGVPASLPALIRAQRIGERVSKVGFDWPDLAGSRAKVSEELSELDAAAAAEDPAAIEEELGDALFALVNYARHVGVDAEGALRKTSDKFARRFGSVEKKVIERHGGWPEKGSAQLSLEELDGYWESAKSEERK